MTKQFKKTVCLDFDGVLNPYTSGWKGVAIIPDPPLPGTIEALLAYLDASFNVAVFSSRSKSICGRWAMKRYLGNAIADHWTAGGVSSQYETCYCRSDAFDIVHALSWPWFKPAAWVTIDDRAICFDGTWPHPDEISSFRPWNKKGAES